jgi:hypothetical protein
MILTREGKKLPGYGSFPMILSPYSNRGERIRARISMHEKKEREIIKNTCVINKDKRKNRVLALEFDLNVKSRAVLKSGPRIQVG